MAEAEKDMVSVLLRSGRRQDVLVVARVGEYVVHNALVVGNKWWAVTHAPSGYAVWIVWNFEKAMEVAQWLQQHAPAPVRSGEGVVEWRKALPPERRDEIIRALHRIAPRADGRYRQSHSLPM